MNISPACLPPPASHHFLLAAHVFRDYLYCRQLASRLSLFLDADMPCCGIIPGASNLNPTLREEVLHKHTITQICAPPSDQQKKGSDNVRAWMRVLLCLATFSTSLICAAFLVQSEAEADTFCACISGEEVTTDVVATCSVQGSSEFSCPYDCLFGGSPVNADNWRTEWNTDSFCGGHSDVAGAYTCEPTVACCVAFMDHLEERNKDHSGEHYSDWSATAPHTQPAPRTSFAVPLHHLRTTALQVFQDRLVYGARN